ncbi:metallophosphoesterase family protein [Companilactobacillus sp. DQM5]|uniref:metallophosphoesterase family protein n=1 Tax=Companilactobacillus sp. DQM5 TaxID=3463359 RepID=UPI0040584B9B
MKFIHAADIHLGHLFQGVKKISENLQEQFRYATFDAFKKITNTAIEEKVDFIIFAGDEYDRHKRSLKEQRFLYEQFSKLKNYDIKVFLIYGNHDYLFNEATFIKFPDNVYSFGENVETVNILTKDKEQVAISGFSYNQQHVSKNYIDEFPEKDSKSDYQIGIVHGMLESQSTDYAPFNINEMISKGYDYWALGHIHKREILNQDPPIVYSGDIQGLNRTETDPKGFYLVGGNNGKLKMNFIESQVFLWDSISINVQSKYTVDDIKNEVLKNTAKFKKNTLISINIENVQRLVTEVQNQIEDDDFLTYIQQILQDRSIYVYKIKTIYSSDSLFQEMDKKYWDESKKDVFTKKNIKSLDKKTGKYSFIKEHIEDDNFINDIIQRSNTVLNRNKEG